MLVIASNVESLPHSSKRSLLFDSSPLSTQSKRSVKYHIESSIVWNTLYKKNELSTSSKIFWAFFLMCDVFPNQTDIAGKKQPLLELRALIQKVIMKQP